MFCGCSHPRVGAQGRLLKLGPCKSQIPAVSRRRCGSLGMTILKRSEGSKVLATHPGLGPLGVRECRTLSYEQGFDGSAILVEALREFAHVPVKLSFRGWKLLD